MEINIKFQCGHEVSENFPPSVPPEFLSSLLHGEQGIVEITVTIDGKERKITK
jgi:hypothetical protein